MSRPTKPSSLARASYDLRSREHISNLAPVERHGAHELVMPQRISAVFQIETEQYQLAVGRRNLACHGFR